MQRIKFIASMLLEGSVLHSEVRNLANLHDPYFFNFFVNFLSDLLPIYRIAIEMGAR